MPEELLDRVMREIRERRARAQAAWQESRQLERALQALEGQQSRPAASPLARPQRARHPRAARGQTREAVLRVVAQRPGVSAAEVAAVAGLEPGLTQTTLGRLVRQGEVERFALPSGTSGYRLPPHSPRPRRLVRARRRGRAARSARGRSDLAAGVAQQRDETGRQRHRVRRSRPRAERVGPTRRPREERDSWPKTLQRGASKTAAVEELAVQCDFRPPERAEQGSRFQLAR